VKRLTSLFAIIALMPAALAVTPASASPVLHLAICSGTEAARSIDVPLPGKPAGNGEPCCMKGCHAGGNRKRARC
jgi:hypothetical protein